MVARKTQVRGRGARHHSIAMRPEEIEDKLAKALNILREAYGIRCSLTPEELLTYITAPTYEEDKITPEEILPNDLLLLHEVAEACELKGIGHEISEDISMRAYPDTCRAHLAVMRVEMEEARRNGLLDHVRRRCLDLSTYLEDPYLPEDLWAGVEELMREFCGCMGPQYFNAPNQ